jgi:hypothetical protein
MTVSHPTPKTLAFWSHHSATTHPYSCMLARGKSNGQVEISRKVSHAPLATKATRTPSKIYLKNIS